MSEFKGVNQSPSQDQYGVLRTEGPGKSITVLERDDTHTFRDLSFRIR